MECDCGADSLCTATSAHCRNGTTVWGGWGLDVNGVLTAAAAVVGYVVYRFSQAAFPFLIRWPIRLICSLTGLSTLWSWVSHLVRTVRVIQILFLWLSQIWRFNMALLSKLHLVPVIFRAIPRSLLYAKHGLESVIAQQQNITKMDMGRSFKPCSCSLARPPHLSNPYCLGDPGLRLILLGPSGGGRTSLANTLLGCRVDPSGASPSPRMETTRQRVLVDGRELTVIDTPDLLGSSLRDSVRAREALRSLQLASPGPHAVLLVLRAPGSAGGVDSNSAALAMRVTLELFGDGVTAHVLTVLTHTDHLGSRGTLSELLEVNAAGLKTALLPCELRAELVDNGLDLRPEARSVTRKRLVERVEEMRALRGHFIHELQRREDCMKEELVADMASVLARKLGHM